MKLSNKNTILITIICLEALMIMFLGFLVSMPKENIRCYIFTEFENLHNAVFTNISKLEDLKQQGVIGSYFITGEGLPSGDISCQTRGQIVVYVPSGKAGIAKIAIGKFIDIDNIKVYFIEND